MVKIFLTSGDLQGRPARGCVEANASIFGLGDFFLTKGECVKVR